MTASTEDTPLYRAIIWVYCVMKTIRKETNRKNMFVHVRIGRVYDLLIERINAVKSNCRDGFLANNKNISEAQLNRKILWKILTITTVNWWLFRLTRIENKFNHFSRQQTTISSNFTSSTHSSRQYTQLRLFHGGLKIHIRNWKLKCFLWFCIKSIFVHPFVEVREINNRLSFGMNWIKIVSKVPHRKKTNNPSAQFLEFVVWQHR